MMPPWYEARLRRIGLLLCVAALLLRPAIAGSDTSLPCEPNCLRGHAALLQDGRVNVLVEIPAGTNAKWEVTKDGDEIAWERKNGKLRVVSYLSYPANYGMIPQTVQSKEEGGDGDPLDVLLLGPAVPRGSVVPARVVGVLRLLDDGEKDDKILAVPSEGPFSEVSTLAELEARYPGVSRILEDWFSHYKGFGEIETRGFGEEDEALASVRSAHAAYRAATSKDSP